MAVTTVLRSISGGYKKVQHGTIHCPILKVIGSAQQLAPEVAVKAREIVPHSKRKSAHDTIDAIVRDVHRVAYLSIAHWTHICIFHRVNELTKYLP